jgi:hypothetical protein
MMTKEEFKNREIIRYQTLKRKGWKEIRLISPKDVLPDDERIKDWIEHAIELVKNNHNWVNIYLEDGKIEYKKQ